MAKHLRNLALTFENPESGEFIWIIREGPIGGHDYPDEVAAAQGPCGTFEDAMRAGYDHLATMLHGDRKLGPLVDAQPPGDISPQSAEYQGRLIEVYAGSTTDRTYRPYVRIHPSATPASGWISPPVPCPHGGFVDPQDAMDTALTAAEMVIDGTYASLGPLLEGGPD